MQQIQERLLNYRELYRIQILMFGGLLLVVLAYLLLVMPLYSQRLETAQALEQFKEQIATLRVYDISAEEFLSQQNERSRLQQTLLEQLPASGDDFAAIMQLTSAVKSNNLSLRSIKANSLIKQDNYQLQRLDCIVSGGYFELIALLEHLQNRQPLTNVQMNSINLEADNKLSVSMQVQIYILP